MSGAKHSDKPRCGAKKRSGGTCQNFAGQATDHPGYGQCSRHGGATESGRKSASRQKALDTARRYAITEVAIDPMEAMLSAIRLAAGIRQSYLVEMTEVDAAKDPEKYERLRLALRQANRELAQTSGETVRAGVAERQVRLAERIGGALSAAIEEGLAVLREALGDALTPELVAKMVGTTLARLESFEGQAFEEPEQIPERVEGVYG